MYSTFLCANNCFVKVGRWPFFSFSFSVHLQGMQSTEITQTTSCRKQGCSSRVPAGSRGLPRHAVKAPLIPVLLPDRPCIAGCCFIVTEVGDITPCAWLWLVWMSGCQRNYRHIKEYLSHMHTHTLPHNPRYFRFHSWIDLGLSGEFKMWHFHSALALLFQQAWRKSEK